MSEQALISGTVNRFLFQDVESGYVVFVLDIEDTNAVTVKGTLPPVQPGQEVELRGRWIMDPKYGRQFEALSCQGSLPSSVNGLKKFLGSGFIKGIGKAYADKLVSHFGTHVLTVIDKHPERLCEIAGIGPKRIQTIAEAWKTHKEIAEVMVFLNDKGISPALGARIYRHYKHNTIPIILQNPYRLAEEVWGVGFKTADAIAHKLGFASDAPQRITAGILFALLVANQQGHLYVEIQELKKNTHTLLDLPEDSNTASLLKRELHRLYDQGKIKLITQGDRHFLGTSRCYTAEQAVAGKLKALLQRPSPLRFSIDTIYRELHAPSSHESLVLHDNQVKGILTCLQKKVTVITGGPGTGKTTLIKKLLEKLERERIRYKLAAPTGRAAKRISESTGRSAATIHRLLEFDPLTMSFKHNEKAALALDFLVIDEASMIDIFLANALLKAVPLDAHVVFIGDSDQLPSVGAGNFLSDCIASNEIPFVRLSEVFRQAQDSLIIVNAHRTNRGEFPVSFLPDAKRDFLFIKESDPTSLPYHLKKIFFSELIKHKISSQDALVLSPMNKGSAGAHLLNQHLQNLLNPSATEELIFNGTCFRTGDRVMQIRNNYDKFIFNGDLGFIESISKEDRQVTVNFGERVLEYDFTELNELVLAYAVTIHKSQGSEYRAVIIPLFTQHFTLLQRNLIYTAITRARSLCIIIGEPKALAIALRNNKGTQRTTFLQKFLKESINSSHHEP
jgi:exodeoxyribonuclease V alpha subunit